MVQALFIIAEHHRKDCVGLKRDDSEPFSENVVCSLKAEVFSGVNSIHRCLVYAAV